MLSALPIEVLQYHIVPKLDSLSQLTLCKTSKQLKTGLELNILQLKETALTKLLLEDLFKFKHIEVQIAFSNKYTLEITWILNRLHVITKKRRSKHANHTSFVNYQQGIKATLTKIAPQYLEEPITVKFGNCMRLYEQACLRRRYEDVFEIELF
jgi:hypothetical protein